MDDAAPGPVPTGAPERVGTVLRAARERQGLSLAEVGARTRVPLRHLEAIEAGDYAGLPSPTYATGFAKAYARAVGADEVAVARGVREELVGFTRPQREYQPYEPSDPARVPSRGVAIVALGLALAVLILAGLWYATGLFRGGSASAPAVVTPAPGVAVPLAPAAAPTATAPQVLITATDEVWLRIYDANGKTLHQGTLKPGESFDVPPDATDPMINVGRPDKISVTVNGSQLQGLELGDRPIKDVRVGAAALQARAAGRPEPARAATSAPAAATPARSTASPTASRERPSAARAPLTETQRANLDAAGDATPAPAVPGNAQ